MSDLTMSLRATSASVTPDRKDKADSNVKVRPMWNGSSLGDVGRVPDQTECRRQRESSVVEDSL